MKRIQLLNPFTRGAITLGVALGALLAGPLTAPGAAYAAPAADGGAVTCTASVVVGAGDTLSALGATFNVPWLNIAQANGITSPYVLFPGESLCIPANPAPSNTTPASAARLSFRTGSTNASATYLLPARQNQYYVFRAMKGQPIIVDVASAKGDVTFGLFAPGGNSVVSAADKKATWQGSLPATGDYSFVIYGGASAENITFNLTIAARIQFARNTDKLTLSGRTVTGDGVTYVAWAAKGQVMKVDVTGAGTNAALTIWGFSDGQPYVRADLQQTSFSFTLPASQDYIVMVVPRAGAVVNYALTVKID